MRSIDGQVVVITGASSGIGRLAALEFARSGAHVVAGARNVRGLETLEAETVGGPGSCVGVETDVSHAESVHALAEAALKRHGRIDTWINNAGIGIWSTVEETRPEEMRRVLDVNVMGVVHGVQAALPVMERQASGTIVNVGSVESRRAMPLQGAYAASKQAVRAYTEALRIELEHEGSPVKVVLLMPSAINTPFFRHARSRLEVLPRPHPPVYEPDAVVDAMLQVAREPVPEVTVGGGGKAMELLQRVSPRLTDVAVEATGWVGQETDLPDDDTDNLFRPIDEPGTTHGEFAARRVSWYTRLIGLHPGLVRAVGAAGAAALIGALAWRSRD